MRTLITRTAPAWMLFGFALIGAAPALGEPFRFNDHHGVAEFGVGGWTQNAHERPFASGAIAVAKTDVTVTHPERPDFDRRFLLLRPDADCLFAPATPAASRRWRVGCK